MADEKTSDGEITTKSQLQETEASGGSVKTVNKAKDAIGAKAKKKAIAAAEEKEEVSSSDEEQLGIFDKPAVIEGKRERKSTEFLRTVQQVDKKEPKLLEFVGKGEKLGGMERVIHEIHQSTSLELKPLHKLLFGRDGRQTEIKKNIKNFNGFSFEKGAKEYETKVAAIDRFTNQGLLRLCEIMDIEKKGKRDDLMPRIMEFLMSPKPSGKPLPEPKKKKPKARPKKRKPTKSKETEGKSRKRKTQTKSKEEVKDSDESEDEKEEEDTDENDEPEEPPKKKKKTEKPKAKATVKAKSPSKKKVVKAKDTKESAKKKDTAEKDKKPAKKAAKKGPVAVKIAPLRKGSPKKTPKKEKPKPVDDESSDEEPLAKKARKQPPTDPELEKAIRDILDGADLEQITMKSVCKEVFEKYPDFDLSARKDFIKETVRKVIS